MHSNVCAARSFDSSETKAMFPRLPFPPATQPSQPTGTDAVQWRPYPVCPPSALRILADSGQTQRRFEQGVGVPYISLGWATSSTRRRAEHGDARDAGFGAFRVHSFSSS